MAGGKVFEAFHAEELMHMVSGMQDFNFKDLEGITEYQNGYHAEHPVIKIFWEVGIHKLISLKNYFQPIQLIMINCVTIYGLLCLNRVTSSDAHLHQNEACPFDKSLLYVYW